MSKFYRKRKKSNLIIAILAVLIMEIAVGYALFSSQLQINGIVVGSGHFKVYFIEAWVEDSSKGTAIINTTQGSDKVKYEVTLQYPGDKCLVGTKIKNESSVKVKLNDFTVNAMNESPDIKFDYIPLNAETEKLDVNGICDYRFTIEWDKDSINTNPGPVTFEIGLEYEQDTETPDVKPSHDHGEGEIYIAYFNPNGGTISQNSMQITHGKKYGEMPTPTKTEYTFLGWYTANENGNLVTANDTVDVENDITLYAVWNWDGHNMSYIERVEPTCTANGNIAYYKCLNCNRLFSDEEGDNEITDVILPATGHEITSVSRVEPTCEENGNIAHYSCSKCNKMFSDEEGKNEITDVVLPAIGHNLLSVSKVDATCIEQGNNPYYSCLVCSSAFKDASAIVATTVADETTPALGHDYTVEEQSATYLKTTATCTQNGEYYKKCSRCSVSSKNDTNVTFTTSKLAHSYTAKSQTSTYLKTSATCQVSGEYYYKCATCTASSKGDTNTSYSTGTVNHNYNSKTTTSTYKKSDATCKAAATYYYKCQWCTEKGSSSYSSGSKADHSYTANCSTCSGNGYTEKYSNWYYCSKGNHCIVVNHCDTHNTTSLPRGYTAIKVCTKCGSQTTLYRPLSSKGTGKQCKWCGTAKK